MSDFVALRLDGLTADSVVAAAKKLVASKDAEPSGSFLVMRVSTVRVEKEKEESEV